MIPSRHISAQEMAQRVSRFEALKPFSSGGIYLNFLTEEESQRRINTAFGAETYDRLRRIKTVYDPDNLFRGNLNIPPL